MLISIFPSKNKTFIEYRSRTLCYLQSSPSPLVQAQKWFDARTSAAAAHPVNVIFEAVLPLHSNISGCLQVLESCSLYNAWLSLLVVRFLSYFSSPSIRLPINLVGNSALSTARLLNYGLCLTQSIDWIHDRFHTSCPIWSLLLFGIELRQLNQFKSI